MRRIAGIGISLLMFGQVFAQISTQQLSGRVNTITTAVPLMRISPNARSGAMGETGLATTPDVNSIHWNASKLAFIDKDFGLGVSYTPWLRALVNDIYLSYLSGYKKVGKDQTIGMSLRYFSLGDIQFTDIVGNDVGSFKPNEFAVDGAYARKITNNFSVALTLRFIYSNLAAGQNVNGVPIKPGKAIATDVSMFYNKDIKLGEMDANWAFGANISNIGSKISYTESSQRDFLPMNLGLGYSLKLKLDNYNEILFAFDLNKLLVPTPDTVDANSNGVFDYREKSVPGAMFSSFGDAPGGFGEEMSEIIISTGIEYWYDKQFAVRAGYFHEDAKKGNRKYFTLGAGLRYNVFGLDFSYLIPTNAQQNPLNNTLRFTLVFNFEAFAKDTDTPKTE